MRQVISRICHTLEIPEPKEIFELDSPETVYRWFFSDVGRRTWMREHRLYDVAYSGLVRAKINEEGASDALSCYCLVNDKITMLVYNKKTTEEEMFTCLYNSTGANGYYDDGNAIEIYETSPLVTTETGQQDEDDRSD